MEGAYKTSQITAPQLTRNPVFFQSLWGKLLSLDRGRTALKAFLEQTSSQILDFKRLGGRLHRVKTVM
jgi:hypothetical protein